MNRTIRICLAGWLAMAGTGFGETTLQDVLSGKNIPLTMKLKDLNEDWRRFTANAGDAGNPLAAYAALVGRGAGGSGSVFYTKGQTVAVSGETYLIAYRPPAKAPDLVALQQAMMRGGQPPEPEKPTPPTTLTLALLNLRTTGSLTDIRPFNLEFELTGNESAVATPEDQRAQETNTASMNNLRKLATAILTYERERKVLPILTDAKSAQEDLALYVSGKTVFAHPETKEPYRPNSTLSGKRLADIAKPEKMVVYYEAKPGADGTRGVLYLDGHAERILDASWTRLKQDSQIP